MCYNVRIIKAAERVFMQKTQAAVKVTDLQMRYGTNTVLDGVTFEIKQGEVLVLLGPNGAGKTTTIEILEGFRGRSGGEVEVLGTDPINGDEAWRARIGVVLQSWRDHSKWNVRTLLDHLGKYYEAYSAEDHARPRQTDELLEAVGLTKQAGKKVMELSGGQRRRLDVAIGLVGNPEVLFLDEPTVGFDPKARREFHDVIHRLSDMDGTTILLTTHDLDEAEKLSDRIIILAGGRIVANGTAEQLAREVAGKTEIIWTQNNERHVHTSSDATDYTRKLLVQYPKGISDLEVKRSSLEDTYVAIVEKYEHAQQEIKEAK